MANDEWKRMHEFVGSIYDKNVKSGMALTEQNLHSFSVTVTDDSVNEDTVENQLSIDGEDWPYLRVALLKKVMQDGGRTSK